MLHKSSIVAGASAGHETLKLHRHAWKSRMPSVAEPNLVPSSLRSAISCSTNADDESDSAAPITIASSMLFTDASFGDCAESPAAVSMQQKEAGAEAQLQRRPLQRRSQRT